MQVVKAQSKDIEIILSIIGEARQIMRETGNMTQWDNGYPSSDVILNDIGNDEAFVCVQNEVIVGYFCFMKGENPDSNYDVIENGEWLNDDPYGVIHRLASGRQAKGIAGAAFDYAFSRIANIRVDTHHENIPMQNFLKKNGFSYCGVIYVNDGTPRDAFQKISNPVI
ncbi:MAG: N-acetyltransferase [Flavobacterium sp.]|nr:MAG: N-acetyltransferase [Flavobacterium sp.]